MPGKRQRFWWILSFLAAGCGVVAGIIAALFYDLPQIRALQSFRPSATTRVLSKDGALLAEFYREKRNIVPLTTIPEELPMALLATEDRQFYAHIGIDLKGIARALVKDIRSGKFAEGASTITQQLARGLFLKPDKTLKRKIREAILALQIERRLTKDEILELYLNQVYFGSGAYGVASAAEIFFGKAVEELTLDECALIAGMPKAPSRISPLVDREKARKRRNVVLAQMVQTGAITKAQYEKAAKRPVVVAVKKRSRTLAPYFVEYIRPVLESIVGPSRLYREGFTITTTLDNRLQEAAEQAMASGLSDMANRTASREIDESFLQGSLISIKVSTGEILAMVGGKNFSESPFNRATSALRQPGSAFKPVLYAYAVENGMSQNDLILDAPVSYPQAPGKPDWRPQNFSHDYEGEISLRWALADSKNIPAVRLIERLGPKNVARFGAVLGIDSPLKANLSLALGTSEVTLMEITRAYSVFPNRGKKTMPYGVSEISDHTGRIVWRSRTRQEAVMSREGAAIMTDLLQAVVTEGTGRSARRIGRPVGGKTGTTEKDAWFVGFSPSIATGVWVGSDLSAPLPKAETGSRAALPMWTQYMAAALEVVPTGYFDIPNDMVRIWIDSKTGHVMPENTDGAVRALFRKNDQP